MNEPERSVKHLLSSRVLHNKLTAVGLFAGLVLGLAGCGGGGKNVYQYVGDDLDGGWILIDGDSVTLVDPDSDGIQQAVIDIEEKQVNSNSDAYDVERGALNEAKDMVMLEDGDSASIEFADDMIRVAGEVVYIPYDADLAQKDRESAGSFGG